MTIDPRLADAWARLPDYLGSHVLVSGAALAIGLGISLPVAILSVRRPLLRASLLAAASVVQTIPGLALLFLLLFFGGVYQLLRRRLETPAPALLWYAGDLLGLWSDRQPQGAVEAPSGPGPGQLG